MSYFKVLGLQQEPFSTSPDPHFFFRSEPHYAALCRLQVAIALKRGLSVVLGDVGTGKTTLSRRLSIALHEDENVQFRMILNPYFRTEKQFLSRLAALFRIPVPESRATALDYMEAIERYLFHMGVEQNKTVVLLVDEAQLLPDFVFELLRILLNYETNEAKILQLVLTGQMELLPRIVNMPNFWDRIALKLVLKPLAEGEIRDLIQFRLRQAGATRDAFFTGEAVHLVYEHTGGYPRKVSQFCHQILEHMVMYDRQMVDEALVRRVLDMQEESDGFRELLDAASALPLPAVLESSDDRDHLRVVNGK